MGFGSSTPPVTVDQCQGPRSKGTDRTGHAAAVLPPDKLHVHQELEGFSVSGHEVPDLLPLNNRVKE